ncbi:MAG: glycosyltransferase family 4 protein [candidate division WOR-3 bacterium]
MSKVFFRVLQVSDVYYPHPGGIPEHIKHLSDGLIARGHQVEILTAKFPKKNFSSWEDPPNVIRVGRSVKIPANKSMSSITVSPRVSKRVKEIIQGGNYDIVHTHGPIAPVLPLLAVKHAECKVVSTFHAAHGESLGYEIFSGYLRKWHDRIDGRIAVSEVARETVARYFPGDFRIIPNGVDVRRFNPDNPPLPHLGHGKKILFVGRLEPRKGAKFLFRAMPLVLKRFPDAKLVVVGSGMTTWYKRFIDSSVKDKVIFEGFVNPDLLPRYYTSVDVFCSPATGGESFGIILLEAMASGVPIVASDIPGYRCVMEDGREGYFARPEDPESLANALIRVLSDPHAKEMGKRGIEKARGFYSWERVVGMVEEFYREVMARP